MGLGAIVALWIANVLLAPATGGISFVIGTIVCIIAAIDAISKKKL